jgi:hypothetical protein
MPYIKQERRNALVEGAKPETAGELNYAITMVCDAYIAKTGVSYTKLNEVVGVLTRAVLAVQQVSVPVHMDYDRTEFGRGVNRLAWDYKQNKKASADEVVGVLECAKLEIYRRIAAPYEDKKIVENGDVYTVNK